MGHSSVVSSAYFVDGLVPARTLRLLNSELKFAWKMNYVIHWKTNKKGIAIE